jgi:hypothetical protein
MYEKGAKVFFFPPVLVFNKANDGFEKGVESLPT